MQMLTTQQLHDELEKGQADIQAGRTLPAEQFFAELRDEYGL